jgi:L-ribulokinase
VLVGAHPGFVEAQAAMTGVKARRYTPDASQREVYDELYGLYRVLHDSFGGLSRSADLSQVMKRLIEIKYAQHPAPSN